MMLFEALIYNAEDDIFVVQGMEFCWGLAVITHPEQNSGLKSVLKEVRKLPVEWKRVDKVYWDAK